MQVGRRGLLAGAVGAALGTLVSACTSPEGPASARQGKTAPMLTTAPRTGRAPRPTPSYSRNSARPFPTRREIERRYAGTAPTAWGMDLPGILSRLTRPGRTVALTFDACGGPGGNGYDAALIDLLRAHQARATLFLNERWIAANPGPFHELVADPLFAIGNHGNRHVPLSVTGRAAYGIRGTRNAGEVYDEVVDNADNLRRRLGRAPELFRSGTAHYDDVATRILHDLGTTPVGFDVNGDAGATFTPQQVEVALRGVRPGSIVIAHMNQPGHGTALGMREALPRLASAGYEFVHVEKRYP